MEFSLVSTLTSIDQILDNLYLGNIFGSENLEALKANKITHILTIMD